MNEYKVNDVVNCEVTGVTNYGVFVKLENNFFGLIHISEISSKYVNNIEKQFLIGDIVNAKILEIDNEKRQVKLSIKQIKSKKENKMQLKEKGKGFKPLKENLSFWVEEKLKDLENFTKKP